MSEIPTTKAPDNLAPYYSNLRTRIEGATAVSARVLCPPITDISAVLLSPGKLLAPPPLYSGE